MLKIVIRVYVDFQYYTTTKKLSQMHSIYESFYYLTYISDISNLSNNKHYLFFLFLSPVVKNTARPIPEPPMMLPIVTGIWLVISIFLIFNAAS